MMGFINALPGAVSQGLIWGIMAIGVYITYKILDIADLTVDGSFCTGAALFVVLYTRGANIWLALLAALVIGMAAGTVTGLLHNFCGIPAILAGIFCPSSIDILSQRIFPASNILTSCENAHGRFDICPRIKSGASAVPTLPLFLFTPCSLQNPIKANPSFPSNGFSLSSLSLRSSGCTH